MTAIAAVVSDGKVHMGGDSAGVSGWSLVQRADPKVFVNGPMIMGFTDSFRMGQLLRWSFTPPIHPEGISDDRYMSTLFIDEVRSCLAKGGFAKKENEVERGGTFLVGYHGQIWEVYSDYQVGRSLSDFYAVGSGSDLCIGSLHSTEHLGPVPRLVTALEAAQRFNAGVRAPFNLEVEP